MWLSHHQEYERLESAAEGVSMDSRPHTLQHSYVSTQMENLTQNLANVNPNHSSPRIGIWIKPSSPASLLSEESFQKNETPELGSFHTQFRRKLQVRDEILKMTEKLECQKVEKRVIST